MPCPGCGVVMLMRHGHGVAPRAARSPPARRRRLLFLERERAVATGAIRSRPQELGARAPRRGPAV
eukprot:7308256-Prymnesium_polylepis.2